MHGPLCNYFNGLQFTSKDSCSLCICTSMYKSSWFMLNVPDPYAYDWKANRVSFHFHTFSLCRYSILSVLAIPPQLALFHWNGTAETLTTLSESLMSFSFIRGVHLAGWGDGFVSVIGGRVGWMGGNSLLTLMDILFRSELGLHWTKS